MRRGVLHLQLVLAVLLLGSSLPVGSAVPVQKVVLCISNSCLEHLLCDTTSLEHDTNITLYPNITYVIHPGEFCLVHGYRNGDIKLTIQGNSSSDLATVECKGLRGFGFYWLRLKIENILIKNCGGAISSDAVRSINDSTFYFGPGQRAVFLFVHCLSVDMTAVTITNYTGYSMIGFFDGSASESLSMTFVRIENSALSLSSQDQIADLPPSCNNQSYSCSGSGIFLYYSFPKTNSYSKISLHITDCQFLNNYNYLPNGWPTVVDVLTDPRIHNTPITGGGALTVVFEHAYTLQSVMVSHCYFAKNGGVTAGAVMVVYKNRPRTATVSVTGSNFENNFAPKDSWVDPHYIGSDITAYYNFMLAEEQCNRTGEGEDCLKIKNSNFSSSTHAISSPHLAFIQFTQTYGSCNVTLEGVDCIHLSHHGCLYSMAWGGNQIGHNLNMLLEDISARAIFGYYKPESSDFAAVFSFVNLGMVMVIGSEETTSSFHGNLGPVIRTYATDLQLKGFISFKNNSADNSNGAAIILQSNSHLLLHNHLHMVFEGNNAVYGGAIYSMESNNQFCILQFITEKVYTRDNITKLDINLTFIENIALVSGDSIYLEPIYNCDLYLTSPVKVSKRNLHLLYKHIFHFPNKQSVQISSSATDICFCERSRLSCYESPLHMSTYPGRQLSIGMVPVDGNGSYVYSPVTTSVDKSYGWKLGGGQDFIQLFANCTTVYYTIYIQEDTHFTDNGYLHPRPLNGISSAAAIGVTLMKCPGGFQLNATRGCSCNPALHHHNIDCNINTGNITRPGNSWIGIIHQNVSSPTVGFASTCPSGYCNSGVAELNISLSDHVLCSSNRSGIMCGSCGHNYSSILGSSECSPNDSCSDMWLLTIPLFAVAGILLVILLFILRITVATGTVNGLIFYTNVLSTFSTFFLNTPGLRWLLVFISLINLDLGFPLCFYRGMDTAAKFYLQYAFPVYLWSIVILIIAASRYSFRIARLTSRSAVPVLATLIHLSYSKLLRVVVDSLAYATVEISDTDGNITSKAVWYFNGNVEYFQHSHFGLFILALVTLLFFLIPYTILMSGICIFMRYRLVNRFQPMIDAYCGPYKDKWRFWFGARLWVLIVIFTAYSVLRADHPLSLIFTEALALSFFTFAQSAIKPFKNALINTLDIFFMVNGFILFICALYIGPAGEQSTLLPYVAGVLVGLTFLAFLFIMSYHIWLVLCGSNNKSTQLDISTSGRDYQPIP